MERLVTPPRRGTSPTWGPPPPCEQALSILETEMASPSGKCLFAQNLGSNLSEIEVKTFVSIKKVTLDKLLASKAEIIHK